MTRSDVSAICGKTASTGTRPSCPSFFAPRQAHVATRRSGPAHAARKSISLVAGLVETLPECASRPAVGQEWRESFHCRPIAVPIVKVKSITRTGLVRGQCSSRTDCPNYWIRSFVMDEQSVLHTPFSQTRDRATTWTSPASAGIENGATSTRCHFSDLS